jgi:putative oligomerization/nucleic acid binding protein/phospholipase D-like protein
MVIADYPFWSVLGSMLFFFLWVIWFWLLIKVFADVFRRDDIGGGAKTLWIIFVIILPYLGVFIYLITQSHHIAQRDMSQAQSQKAQFDDYVRSVSGSGGGAAGEIAQAKQLLDQGTITQTEYDALKAKALGTA